MTFLDRTPKSFARKPPDPLYFFQKGSGVTKRRWVQGLVHMPALWLKTAPMMMFLNKMWRLLPGGMTFPGIETPMSNGVWLLVTFFNMFHFLSMFFFSIFGFPISKFFSFRIISAMLCVTTFLLLCFAALFFPVYLLFFSPAFSTFDLIPQLKKSSGRAKHVQRTLNKFGTNFKQTVNWFFNKRKLVQTKSRVNKLYIVRKLSLSSSQNQTWK